MRVLEVDTVGEAPLGLLHSLVQQVVRTSSAVEVFTRNDVQGELVVACHNQLVPVRQRSCEDHRNGSLLQHQTALEQLNPKTIDKIEPDSSVGKFSSMRRQT